MAVKIKLCGMFREEDIEYANEALPDFAGFVVMFPKSHRNIDIRTAQKLKARLSPKIKTVAVSVNADVHEFAEFARQGIADILQCHGNEDEEYISELRKLANVPIIKAVKVTGENDYTDSKGADFLLLDSGTGSGVKFDHSLIDAEKIKVPFFLAGGLTPENLAEIAEKFKPYAVDLSSGIETNKVKDREKMIKAVRAIRNL